MNQVNLAGNLIRLRHEKNVTQEQLADFLGITKASVSKPSCPTFGTTINETVQATGY